MRHATTFLMRMGIFEKERKKKKISTPPRKWSTNPIQVEARLSASVANHSNHTRLK